MENARNIQPNSVRKVMWEAIKKPLIWVTVMFVASVSLVRLNDNKTDFDKKASAALLLVNDDSFDARGKGVRPVFLDRLISTVKECPCLSERIDSATGFDSGTIIRNGLGEALFQPLKSKEDLIIKLNDGLQKQKIFALKDIQNRIDIASKSISERDDQAALAIAELRLKTTSADGLPRSIAQIMTLTSKASPLRTALEHQYPNPHTAGKPDGKVIEESVNAYFNEDKRSYEGVRDSNIPELRKIETGYQNLNRAVYETLADSQKFERIADPITGTTGIALILDEKKGLIVLYKVLWISLMATVLFALLFLILIPLKHLFFWGTSGEILTKQFEELLKRRDSVITMPIVQAVATGLAVVTVGTAALVASPFPISGGPNEPENPNVVQSLDAPPGAAKDPKGAQPTPNQSGNQQAKIDGLEMRIGALDNNITILQGIVRQRDVIAGPPPVDIRPVLKAIGGLDSIIAKTVGKPFTTQPSTLFENLDAITNQQATAAKLEELRGSTKINFDRINTSMGTPRPNQSVFGMLDETANTLGSRLQPDGQTVVRSLSDLTASVGRPSPVPDNQSLFGRTQSVQNSVNSLAGLTSSIRSDQGGPTGRNLLTQLKTLFTREQYKISEFALLEFERDYNGSDTRLIPVLQSMKRVKTYTEAELHRALLRERVSESTWKAWRSSLLKYTRVSRW